MGYKLIIEKSAAKTIEKFDSQPRKQILLFLKDLGQTENSRQGGKPLQGDRRLWRYRVGNYRIIANIDDKTVTITIIKVGWTFPNYVGAWA